MSDINIRERISHNEMLILAKNMGLKVVPVVEYITSFYPAIHTFGYFQELADKQKYDSGYACEGIVIRPLIPFYSRALKEIWSMKILNRDYKL